MKPEIRGINHIKDEEKQLRRQVQTEKHFLAVVCNKKETLTIAEALLRQRQK